MESGSVEGQAQRFHWSASPLLQGRLLHVLPANAKPTEKASTGAEVASSSHKKLTEMQRKAQAGSDFNWNSLFMSVRHRDETSAACAAGAS